MLITISLKRSPYDNVNRVLSFIGEKSVLVKSEILVEL